MKKKELMKEIEKTGERLVCMSPASEITENGEPVGGGIVHAYAMGAAAALAWALALDDGESAPIGDQVSRIIMAAHGMRAKSLASERGEE